MILCRRLRAVALLLPVLVLSIAIAMAATTSSQPAAEAKGTIPDAIALPDGWLPEGIVTGKGPILYAGSRRHGAIYAADPRTGQGFVLVPPQAGRVATGLAYDERTDYLYVAGGAGGAGYIYDARNGASIASFSFTGAPTFVNDVEVTDDGAYFTDSMRPVLYRLPLDTNGALLSTASFETIPLTGDYVHRAGFNINGIEATESGLDLIVVQSNTGLLFRVNPKNGITRTISVGGHLVTGGDGLLVHGNKLWVARNNNLLDEIELADDVTYGRLVREITDPRFDTPTTLDRFGNALYVVQGRFQAGNDPSVKYSILRVEP